MATAIQTTDLPVNLDDEHATIFLGVAPGTLSVWRCRRSVVIPYFKLGRKVMYRRADLEAYIARNTVGTLDVAGI